LRGYPPPATHIEEKTPTTAILDVTIKKAHLKTTQKEKLRKNRMFFFGFATIRTILLNRAHTIALKIRNKDEQKKDRNGRDKGS